jgi:hypothetical protein
MNAISVCDGIFLLLSRSLQKRRSRIRSTRISEQHCRISTSSSGLNVPSAAAVITLYSSITFWCIAHCSYFLPSILEKYSSADAAVHLSPGVSRIFAQIATHAFDNSSELSARVFRNSSTLSLLRSFPSRNSCQTDSNRIDKAIVLNSALATLPMSTLRSAFPNRPNLEHGLRRCDVEETHSGK